MRKLFPGYLYAKASWRFPFEFVELGYQKSTRRHGINTTYGNITYLARDITADDFQQALRTVSGVEDIKISPQLAKLVLSLVFYAEVHDVVHRALVAVAYQNSLLSGDAVNVPPGSRGIQKAEQSALVQYIRNNPRLFAGELERCRLADELRAELGE